MNLNEGARRLAIFLGIIGAILGGVASYVVLNDLLEARARYKAFELLATSQTVKQESATLSKSAAVKALWVARSPSERDRIMKSLTAEEMKALAGELGIEGDTPRFSNSPAVNKEGIKTIHWNEAFEVESLDMIDGQTLYVEPAPNRWLYFLAAILPLLGFILPWGLVRTVAWVGVGFGSSPK